MRASSLNKLVQVYKSVTSDATPLAHFTGRFEERFVEMLCDTSPAVATEAIKLVTELKKYALLTIPPLVTRGMPSSPYLPWCHVAGSACSQSTRRRAPT